MKRLIFAALAIGCLLLFRGNAGKDLGNLKPVQLVQVTTCNGKVRIRTDTGSMGQGMTVAEAVTDLQNGADGTVFLETADFLLVTALTTRFLPELGDFLRPGTEIARISSYVDGETAAKYLSAHHPAVTLRQAKGNHKMENLHYREGRYELEREIG